MEHALTNSTFVPYINNFKNGTGGKNYNVLQDRVKIAMTATVGNTTIFIEFKKNLKTI